MECRSGCGACCVAPSISSPIPGMPQGKPAGVRCVQLTADERCLLFGRPERPAVCASLRPSEEMCGESRADAYARLTFLECATASEERASQDLSAKSGSGLMAPPAA
ncbi:MAG TPA: YkgJ family cysteine cluster protein [Pyrinomonadaceae bacterium]|nr:YkgJ family cysteine cluster protein [Pyrinomonadaceae bacterium]